MECDSALFRIDVISIDGDELPIEDGSATVDGAGGWEFEPSLSATGPDYFNRKRIARTLKCKLQFNGSYDPLALTKICNAQIVMTDTVSGRRLRAGKCVYASMGEIGNGPVEVSFTCLVPFQWL